MSDWRQYTRACLEDIDRSASSRLPCHDDDYLYSWYKAFHSLVWFKFSLTFIVQFKYWHLLNGNEFSQIRLNSVDILIFSLNISKEFQILDASLWHMREIVLDIWKICGTQPRT